MLPFFKSDTLTFAYHRPAQTTGPRDTRWRLSCSTLRQRPAATARRPLTLAAAQAQKVRELHYRKQRSSHRPCPHRSRAGLPRGPPAGAAGRPRVHGGRRHQGHPDLCHRCATLKSVPCRLRRCLGCRLLLQTVPDRCHSCNVRPQLLPGRWLSDTCPRGRPCAPRHPCHPRYPSECLPRSGRRRAGADPPRHSVR